MLDNYFKIRRTFVRQFDQKDCGPASLLSVLRFYGGDTTLADLRNRCFTSSRGTTMYDIVETAKEIGFYAKGMIGTYENLMEIDLPCIVHWILENGLQHYVVIYGITKRKIEVGDPGRGVISLSRTQFDLLWQTKSVIILDPGKELLSKKVLSWYKWLLHIIKKERVWIYQIVFLGLIYSGIGLLTAVYIRYLIDKFIPIANQKVILWSALFLCFLFALRALIGWIQNYFLIVLNKRVGIHLNAHFITRLFQLSQRFFDTRKRGDITARLHDCIYIQNAVGKICGTSITDLMIIMSSVIYMYILSAELAVITLSLTPMFVIPVFFHLRDVKKKQYDVMHSFATMESTYIDSLSGIDEIISFNTNHIFSAINRRKYKRYQENTARLGKTQAQLNFLSEITTSVISLVVLTSGALFIIRGEIEMGQMIAAYTLLAHIIPSIGRSIDTAVAVQGARVASKRILDIILQDREKKMTGMPFLMNQSLQIKKAQFAWTRTSILLNDIKIILKKGYITTLFGQSGAGKTTIVNLLQRKYTLNHGDIFIDTIKAEAVRLGEYRRRISVVPQHVWVFTGTLLENILIGRNSVNPQTLSDFINKYHLDPFIERFQQGLFTFIGEEGRRLSGGEKQIVALLRALLLYPDVLIIDEGFNAMDHELYNFFIKLIKMFSRTSAIFVTTHDPKMIAHADYIYNLEEGYVKQLEKPTQS